MFFLLLNLWFSTPSFADPSAFNEEANFFSIIVGFRTQLKLSPLLTDDRLMASASKHAQWMANKRILTHIGPSIKGSCASRAYFEGVPSGTLVGENIARGSYTAPETFVQWFFSPHHLEGMLTPQYTHVGISRQGCEEANQDAWSCFWVNDFADLSNRDQSQTPVWPVYTNEELFQAAEKMVGPLDENQKLMFRNPTLR